MRASPAQSHSSQGRDINDVLSSSNNPVAHRLEQW
jgi:hypothetical protein